MHQSPRNNPFVRPRGDSRPTQKLPFELLSRLFEFGAAYNRPLNELCTTYKYELLEEGAGEGRASKNTSAAPFPVTVSHVCRHWRHVAISTASLWTDVRLSSAPVLRPPYKLVSLYLERSKILPIDITVNSHPSDSESENLNACFHAESLYTLLIPHVNRWRSIELKCTKPQQMSAFLDAIFDPSTHSPSRLESIRLYDLYELQVHHRTPLLSDLRTLFSGSAPQLKHLLLFGVHVEWSQMISATSNLTRLELFYHFQPFQPSWAEFTTILRGVPRLQKLALCQSGPAGLPEEVLEPSATNATMDVNSPLPLLHLTDLVLGSQPEDVVITLVRGLYMPALKTLILDLDDEDYSDFVDELIRPATSLTPPTTEDPPPSLLTRLERLAILSLSCEDDELMSNMFDQLDNLKALRLTSSDDSNSDHSTLHQLLLPTMCPEMGVVVCALPRLESLLVSPSMAYLPLLRDLVEHRRNEGFPLKSLYITMDERMPKVDMLWFRQRLETFGFTDHAYCWQTDSAFEGLW